MIELLGALVVATVALVVVTFDALRVHGRVLRRVHELDPPGPLDPSGPADRNGAHATGAGVSPPSP